MYKGSIAIDGISLTIAALEGGVLSVTIIPHTFRNTTLGGYRPGARVNLECDILAKHVEKLLRKLDLKKPLTVEKLRDKVTESASSSALAVESATYRIASETSTSSAPPQSPPRSCALRPVPRATG